MASGHRFQGVDFDDLFDQDIMGNGPSTPNLRGPGGVPLRYAHIQYGSKRADVGRRQNGSDVSNLWAAKGTAQYSLPFNGQTFSSHNQALTNSSGNALAAISLSINSDGTYQIREVAQGGGNNRNNIVASGTWLPAGASVGEFEVQFETANVGAATISNAAPSYASCTTSRALQASISVVAASIEAKSQIVTFVCRLRRNGAGGSVTTMYAGVSAAGWT